MRGVYSPREADPDQGHMWNWMDTYHTYMRYLSHT
jgi:hypothetical protein